jgi:hypothetical protein
MMTFSFMNPLVYGINQKTQIIDDKLPPLADYDDCNVLMERSRRVGHYTFLLASTL